jgi:hypothetical protein
MRKKIQESNLYIYMCVEVNHSYLFDPVGILDIESLSILLNERFLNCFNSNVFPVQFTGTKTTRVRMVIGTNIFKLQKICVFELVDLSEIKNKSIWKVQSFVNMCLLQFV